MSLFRDADHWYRVLDALFQRLAEREAVAARLLQAGIVVEFRYTDPEGRVTIDLRRPPLSWTFGETELEPDVVMIQSADTAHEFWLGRLGAPRAIATRRVVARGSIAKALDLLPALKPAHAL